MPLVCALHRVGCSDGFVIYFVDLAVHFSVDRVMPVLVALVPTMRRVNCIDSAGRAILELVGFLIDVTCKLRDLDTGQRLVGRIVMPDGWHGGSCRNCKSAKRNRQRRPNDNLSG